jgi:hypothetical protein
MSISSLNGGSVLGSTVRQLFSQLTELQNCRNSVDWVEETQEVLQQISDSYKRGSVTTDSIKYTAVPVHTIKASGEIPPPNRHS